MTQPDDFAPAHADETVDAFLRRAADVEPPALPSAAQLWWRHEVLERLNEEDRRAARAAAPIRWSATLGAALAVVGAAFLADVALAPSATLAVTLLAVPAALALGVALVRRPG